MIAWWWLAVELAVLGCVFVLAQRWLTKAYTRRATNANRLHLVALQRTGSELAACRMKYAELNNAHQLMVSRYGDLLDEP